MRLSRFSRGAGQGLLFIVILVSAASTSCSNLGPGAGAPDSRTPTPPPTPTIDWFPATMTPAPPAGQLTTPTIEARPAVGRTLLTDVFSDPDAWDVGASDVGSVDVARNRLTLAVQPAGYISSLRKAPVLEDFYFEITAHPSLCRGADDYGVLVRATSLADYAFTLACDGTVRAERTVHTRVEERHVLQPAVRSGDVPPGAPGEVRIGVWASGNEMQLFLNDRFQFSIVDSNYRGGLVGVFARSAGLNAAAVSFSDLTVSAVPPKPAPSPQS